jgi:ATP-dependent helicase/nuclease subunit A
MARFTDEQLAAIQADGKTIVSASAGSGKTTVMIEKIIRLIQDGKRVDEILAVTFTKKAAAQMKEKLCKVLIENINAQDCSAEKRAMLKKQLAEVPNADISTIHSFCSKLIRSHFYAAGVDNTFRVIGGEDAEGTALKNEALNDVFEEGYAAKNNTDSEWQDDGKFAHLLSVYWRKKSDNTLRKIFLPCMKNSVTAPIIVNIYKTAVCTRGKRLKKFPRNCCEC